MKHLVRPHGRTKRGATIQETQAILRHWREAVPNDRLAHLVKDAARALLRALQLRLTAHGVSLGHWTFLRILWEKDGITQRELSEQAGVMEPTTTSALSAMERLGYVVRRKMPGNKKKVFVFLTPRGRLLKAKLVPFAEQVNEVAIHNVKLADIITTTAHTAVDHREPGRGRSQFDRAYSIHPRARTAGSGARRECRYGNAQKAGPLSANESVRSQSSQ